MFRSRPVQYFGLLLLVLACLAIIFYPIGPRPTAQDYTLRFTAPRPFEAMAAADKKNAGKSVSDVADAALVTAFPAGTKLPPQSLSVLPDGRTATLVDRATDKLEAQRRTGLIRTALTKAFPGIQLAAQGNESLADLPTKPLFAFGQYAVYPAQSDTAIKLGLDLQGGVNLVLQVRRALFTYTFDKKLGNDADARDAFAAQVRTALRGAGAGLDEADVNLSPRANNVLEVRTQARDKEQFNAQRQAVAQALKGLAGVNFTEASTQFYVSDDEGDNGGGAGNGSSAALDQTVEIVRARVDSLGVSEPQIQKQEPDRVIVQLPGIRDPQKAIETIGTTALMQILLLPEDIVGFEDPAQPGNFVFRDQGGRGNVVPNEEVMRRSDKIVDGRDVKSNTSAGFDEGGNPAVFFELQGEGADRFAQGDGQVAGKNRQIPVFSMSAPSRHRR
jgi:hypothetical protein